MLNGAGDAYDTLKELGELIDDNTDAIDALEIVAAGKADKTHYHIVSDVSDLQSTLDTKFAKTGGSITGDITLETAETGSPSIVFQRGTSSDAYTDWRIQDSVGQLKFGIRNNSSDFTDKIVFKEAGNIEATSFVGNLTGNADTATALTSKSIGSATNPVYFDANGKPVKTTYTLGKSVPSDAKFTDTTYSAATTSANGLMSSTDKSKLDGITSGANKYTHPSYTAKSSGLYKITVDAIGHVSATTAVAKSDITALGIPSSDTTYSNFVKSGSGAKAGLVPAPSTTAGTTKYLREDGTWAVPPDTNTTYTFNGAVSTIKDSNLTASRALISNSSGKVAVSAVTSTELGYLDGVTSNIQTQLNNKQNKISTETWTFTLEDGSTVTKAVYANEIPMATITFVAGESVNSLYAYISINGTKYAQSSGSVRVPIGTEIMCSAYTGEYSGSYIGGDIYVNGNCVLDGGAYQGFKSYPYTVNGNITVKTDYRGNGTTLHYGEVWITES